MVNYCSVKGCRNNGKDKVFSFHRIPHNETRDRWIQFCNNSYLNPNTAFVCSVHFNKSDYIDNKLYTSLTGFNKNRRLKESAFPSNKRFKASGEIYAADTPDKSGENVLSLETGAADTLDNSGENVLSLETGAADTPDNSGENAFNLETDAADTPLNLGENTFNLETDAADTPLNLGGNAFNYENDAADTPLNLGENREILKLKEEILMLKGENIILNHKITRITEENKTFKLIREENNSLRSEVDKLSKEINSLKSSLDKFLSKNQIKLLSGAKRVNWNHEDYTKAFSLRYLSQKAYVHLRDEIGYPLPSLASLKRIASSLTMYPGINYQFIDYLGISALDIPNSHKFTVLLFDDMKTSEVYEFDPSSDEVFMPSKQMTVVMARGLIGNWKLPVYIDFDNKLTKTILDEIVALLHQRGLIVVAVVSDCYHENRNLWKEYGINFRFLDKTYFLHPSSEQKIYFFADAPHILKLIRNWFIDTGFKWENVIINSEPIKNLIKNKREPIKKFN